MPRCKVCGRDFPHRATHDGFTVSLSHRKRCLACQPWRSRESSGSRQGKAVMDWRRRTKLKAIRYKGGQCVICGYARCVRALVFHHLDPMEKDFGVGTGHCRAWDTLRRELDKCVLLCGNCHDEVHDGVADLVPHLHKNPTPAEGARLIQDQVVDGETPAIPIPPRPKICPTCGAPVSTPGVRCASCARKAAEKVAWPEPARLMQMVRASNYEAVGRDLGVSGNAVRKRLRNHKVAG